ncbi:hypothetical protein BDN71DRAFT_465 [Pleurotus eryngii]|uniref:Uncharacterized protein n=1 Tax=Pleurotus eryngii TaxID=5323 RepID=A0A9P6A8S5_PLEER|nr:hypothetical protein BDN71DRAFT_465 [Pleurotus eryngii]
MWNFTELHYQSVNLTRRDHQHRLRLYPLPNSTFSSALASLRPLRSQHQPSVSSSPNTRLPQPTARRDGARANGYAWFVSPYPRTKEHVLHRRATRLKIECDNYMVRKHDQGTW